MGIINIITISTILFLLTFSIVGIPLVIIYCVVVFSNARKREDLAYKKMKDTLMKDEEIIHQGLQLRAFSFEQRRQLIGITNSRIIILSRGLFGGFTMKDFQWKDLLDITLSENILPSYCGSKLSFKGRKGTHNINGVNSYIASEIYKKGQSEEQAWEEKNRIRKIEETRAAAGGVVLNTGNGNQGDHKKGASSMVEEINKAKKLLDDGTISDSEFNEIKSKILSSSY